MIKKIKDPLIESEKKPVGIIRMELRGAFRSTSKSWQYTIIEFISEDIEMRNILRPRFHFI